MVGDGRDWRSGSARPGLRLVAPAVTPLRAADVARGLASHLRGTGRDEFRQRIASLLGAARTATYTSFRRALGACLLALSESDDRETVLVPAFCSADYRHAVEGVGLSVGRYDVDAETLAADRDSLENRLTADVLAVVAVNAFGYTSPMAAVADCCDDGGVFLLEALGYALGSTYRGDRLGTFGDCALLNFQQGKPVPVGGGMLASQNPSLAIGDEGRPAVGPNVGALAGYAALSGPRGYYVYEALAGRLERWGILDERATTHPASKRQVAYERPFERMSNFQGAVGGRVLDRLESHRRERARTAAYYGERLADCEAVSRVRPVDGLEGHQHVRYPVVAEPPSLRDELVRALADVGVHATPMYDYPQIDADRFPGAARLQRGILTLPTHPYVTDGDRRAVVEAVRAVASSASGPRR